MSREMAVMQRPIKVEISSPVKPEVLKPSNTPNILGTSKAPTVMNKVANNNARGKVTSLSMPKTTNTVTISKETAGKANQKALTNSPKTSVIKSSFLPTKSPLKPLMPIRPSPNTKVSLSSSRLTPHSPSSLATLVRTPSVGSSALTSSATSPSSVSSRSISPVKCRRRINYSDPDAPIPVSRRNARERNRVKQVSSIFLSHYEYSDINH